MLCAILSLLVLKGFQSMHHTLRAVSIAGWLHEFKGMEG